MKRFIDIYIPISKCNLKCHYCYVWTNGNRNKEQSKFKYSAEYIGQALSKERLGGSCHFNMCGQGETLIPKEIVGIIKNILMQGHYIMVVTNGLITKRFNELLEFPWELRKNLGFKFSFHYLELLRTNQMKNFFNNINMVKKFGCSFSVELTPSDELEPYIEDIKTISLERLGAYCHVTIPRIEIDSTVPLLSKHTMEEFKKIWSVFNSELFDFKLTTWQIKRKEFCYAGAWSGLLHIGTGELTSCYGSHISQNIFKDISKPIKEIPIGKCCRVSHCYNSHAFLTLGNIPSIKTYTYGQMRNRQCDDGTEWLNAEMKECLNSRLEDCNKLDYNALDTAKIMRNKITIMISKCWNKIGK